MIRKHGREFASMAEVRRYEAQKGEPMTAKMTPGPWQIEGRLVGGADRVRVADCHVRERDTHTNAANARAIACLPELVEAAHRLIAPFDMPMTAGDVSRLRLTTTFEGKDVQAVRRILARIDGMEGE